MPLRTLTVSATETATTTLNAYNTDGHDDDEDTIDNVIDEKEAGDARAEAITEVLTPSMEAQMRRTSVDLMYKKTVNLMASGMKDECAEANSTKKQKKKMITAETTTQKKESTLNLVMKKERL